MADEADVGCDMEQQVRDIELSLRYKPGPLATGECLSCYELLDYGIRWCDAGCRDKWQLKINRG